MSPWKIDLTLLDLTGYPSNGAEVFLVDNDRLIVRISSESESGRYDDFFVEDHRTTLLTCRDGGITWSKCDDTLPLSEKVDTGKTNVQDKGRATGQRKGDYSHFH